MYKRPDQVMIEKYDRIYSKAKEDSRVSECYLGQIKEYRITSRDSYMQSITDPELMLGYVLYPHYLAEDFGVKEEALNIILDFIRSDDPLKVYQAFSFLCGEIMMIKIHGEVPFILFNRKIVKEMKEKVDEMKAALENYRDGEFGKYKTTMYDMICDIIQDYELSKKNS